MTVGELKQLLEGVDDDMFVLMPVPASGKFDGFFKHPCNEESGVSELRMDEDDADKDEIEELINPSLKEKSFCIVPCGYFSLCEVEDDEPNAEMN